MVSNSLPSLPGNKAKLFFMKDFNQVINSYELARFDNVWNYRICPIHHHTTHVHGGRWSWQGQYHFHNYIWCEIVRVVRTLYSCQKVKRPHSSVSGIVTLLQSTLGTRLPIIQGGSFSFLAPTLAILALPQFQCPETLEGLTEEERRELWQIRMREVQGAIVVSALFEVLLGISGGSTIKNPKQLIIVA